MLKKLAVIVLLAACLPTRGQSVFRSVEDAWAYADEHNISIKNAGWDAGKADAASRQSYLAFLPNVGLNGSYTDNLSLQTSLLPAIIINRNALPGEVIPVRFGQQFIYSGGVSGQMDVLNLQTWFNVRIAREGRELSSASVANTRKTVYEQVASQFYTCQLMTEAARLAGISKAVSDSVYLSVKQKYEQGLTNMASLDVASINQQRASQTAETSVYQARIALNNLKSLLGFSLTDSVAVGSSMPDNITLDPSLPFAEDPAVLVARGQQQVSLAQWKSARSAVMPVFSVAYSNSSQHNANTFEPFKSVPDWYPASFWSLKATWNIFTAGSRWLNVQRSKIAYYQTAAQYESQLKQSAINDENLRLSYLKASTSLERAKNIMRLSLDNYGHISERYVTGIATLDDRLNAYSDYLTFQNQYLNALSDLLVQTYRMKIRQK